MGCSGYILVEGINIYATVFDTDQLSVIRGSSILLAEAISELPRQTKFKGKLEPLSQGASSGLFEVTLQECPTEADYLADVAKQVAEYLSDHEPYRYFTFAVAHFLYVPKDRSENVPLSAIKAALSAKIRRQQIQQLSSAPDPIDSSCNYVPCTRSGMRAARENAKPNDSQDTNSDSIEARLRRGQDLKGSMYLKILRPDEPGTTSTDCHRPTDDELEKLEELTFVNDLETLGHNTRYETLNNKIAVIYLDGNGFGEIQRSKVKDTKDQQAFDRLIRDCRAHFLFHLLTALRDGAWNGHALSDGCREGSGDDRSDSRSDRGGTPQAEGSSKQLRLETLLWGGDEMTLVVPAWLGFDVLQLFYAISAKWHFENTPLTHAGGIVFCHAHSPIAEMRRLATRLADDVKQWMRDNKTGGNWFDYLVLESIDYPTEPTLSVFREHRYGPIATERKPIAPDPEWLEDSGHDCRRLLTTGNLSRGQVFSLARATARAPLPRSDQDDLFPFGPYAVRAHPPWAGGDATAEESAEDPAKGQPPPTALERWEKRLVTIAGEKEPTAVPRLERLVGFLGLCAEDLCNAERRAWLWLHLAELWDYLVPERDRKQEKPGFSNARQEDRR
jgi:hypothetical protein